MAKILIVEDNFMDGMALKEACRAKGREVEHVVTLAAALERAEQGLDVVFLDVTLPDGDGLAAAESLGTFPDQPEVVLLAPDDDSGTRAAIERSAASLADAGPGEPGPLGWWLAKPVDGKLAAQAVKFLLEYRAGGQKKKKKRSPNIRKEDVLQRSRAAAPKLVIDPGAPVPALKEFRSLMEKLYLEHLVKRTGNDANEALRIAGVSRAGYYNLLKKHGLTGKWRDD